MPGPDLCKLETCYQLKVDHTYIKKSSNKRNTFKFVALKPYTMTVQLTVLKKNTIITNCRAWWTFSNTMAIASVYFSLLQSAFFCVLLLFSFLRSSPPSFLPLVRPQTDQQNLHILLVSTISEQSPGTTK